MVSLLKEACDVSNSAEPCLQRMALDALSLTRRGDVVLRGRFELENE